MNRNIGLLIVFSAIFFTSFAQSNQLIDIGKPLVQSNVMVLNDCIVPSSINNKDYTIILFDKGPLNPNNNTLAVNAFKVIFVDLQSKITQIVPIKDKAGNIINPTVGEIFNWQIAADGNIYIATQAGGHLIKIDYKKRTVTDVGVPYNFTNIPNLTTLSFGTDYSLYGIINRIEGKNQGAYSFNYNYNGNFILYDSLPIDISRYRVKYIGADDTHVYVRAEDATYKLYAIDKITKQKKEIQLYYNGAILDASKPFEIVTYIGNYVYARISLHNTAYYWKLYNGKVLDNIPPPVTILNKRVDNFWKGFIYNYPEAKTMWNASTNYLQYSLDNITGSIDLNNIVQKIERATGTITPYLNSAKNTTQLFVHGVKYACAATVNMENNVIESLGVNPTISAYTSIANFNQSNVLIGGYSNGLIQEYNSKNEWNIFKNLNSPAPTDANANPTIKYQLQNPANSSNNIPGVLSVGKILKMKSTQLIIAAGDRGRNNPPNYDDEMAVSIINPASNTFKNVYHDAVFKDYNFGTMCVDDVNQKILVVGLKRKQPNIATAKLFVLDIEGNLVNEPQNFTYNGAQLNNIIYIEIVDSSIYFKSDNIVYCVKNYNNLTGIEKVVTIQGMMIGAMCLATTETEKYIVVVYELPGNEGFKVVYTPITTTNNIVPINDKDVIKVDGTINEKNGTKPYQIINIKNKVIISGFTSLYSFMLN